MFVCLHCFGEFEEPTRWYETHGLDYPPYESCYGSPCCNENYVEAHRCDACGEWITTRKYVRIGDERFCEDCFEMCELKDDY